MSSSISPENQKLLREVVASGPFKSEDEALSEALRLLRDKTPNGSVETVPDEDWTKLFRNWTQKGRVGNSQLDDSRESIYEGRGE